MSRLLSTLSFLVMEHLLLRNERERSLLSPLDELISDNLLLNTYRKKEGLTQEMKESSFTLLHKHRSLYVNEII